MIKCENCGRDDTTLREPEKEFRTFSDGWTLCINCAAYETNKMIRMGQEYCMCKKCKLERKLSRDNLR